MANTLSIKLHCVYELCYNQIECKCVDQIKEEAENDPEYQFLWKQVEEANRQEKPSDYGINKDQLLTFKGKLYIPNRMSLKELIMDEYCYSNYVGHLGYQKMLTIIRKLYF